MVNADTPGYRPRDLTAFDPFGGAASGRATRVGHLLGGHDRPWREVTEAGPLDPNGNGVDMETEVLRATDAQRAHDRALTVYSSSLDILRASIGRGR